MTSHRWWTDGGPAVLQTPLVARLVALAETPGTESQQDFSNFFEVFVGLSDEYLERSLTSLLVTDVSLSQGMSQQQHKARHTLLYVLLDSVTKKTLC